MHRNARQLAIYKNKLVSLGSWYQHEKDDFFLQATVDAAVGSRINPSVLSALVMVRVPRTENIYV
jgi:hypothetical protein